MAKISKRHFLKTKETKKLFQKFTEKTKVKIENVLGKKSKVEFLEVDSIEVYVVDNKPLMAKINEKLIPTLKFKEALQFLPKIIVDMGAVPHICNGADLMAPGIIEILGEFERDGIILIVDEKYGKPLAVGVALFSSEEIKSMEKGKVVENLHYIGDKLWKILKSFS